MFLHDGGRNIENVFPSYEIIRHRKREIKVLKEGRFFISFEHSLSNCLSYSTDTTISNTFISICNNSISIKQRRRVFFILHSFFRLDTYS